MGRGWIRLAAESRSAVEAFAAARVPLLLLCLGAFSTGELVLQIEFVIAFLPAVVDWVRIIRIRV